MAIQEAPASIPTTETPVPVQIPPPTITTIPTTSAPMIVPTPPPTINPEIAFRVSGGYNMQEWYNISRATKNQGTISLHTTVYRYQFRGSYSHLENWTESYVQIIPDSGNRFLFIFTDTWSDTDGTPINSLDYSDFTIQYNGQIISPIFDPYLIREISQYSTTPYGYVWAEDYVMKEKTLQHFGKLTPGESNAWDGYLIFQIPATARPEDLKILYNIGNLGHAWFRFTGGDRFSLN